MRKLIALGVCAVLLLCGHARADAAENQQIIYTYLTETLSLTRAAACGILANIKAESGFRPDAVGDSGKAYGICQWNSRRQSLVNFCEENGYEDWTSLEGQLGYLAYELEHNKKSVGTYLNSIPDTAQGAYDAAWYFCVYFEIPADRYNKGVRRGSTAVNTFYKQYGGEIASYPITYDSNGGSAAPAAGRKTEGVPYALTSAAPTRSGYDLAGWSEDPRGADTVYQPGEYFSENREATFYALWQPAAAAETPADETVSLNGHTYEYFAGTFTWEKAREFAAVKGGYLATVRTKAEYDAVSSLISAAEAPCWLGGEFVSGNWTWVTGETFSDDFASNYWQSGEPDALVGASSRGRLAQSPDGGWIDLAPGEADVGGLIVEYGAAEAEALPLYVVSVSTTLNLRCGPKTSYTRIGSLTPGLFIAIHETTSDGWGWGVSNTGLSGWCSMNASYLTKADLVDEATGLAFRREEDSLRVLGFTRSAKEIAIPEEIDGLPVAAIAKNAFTPTGAPDRLFVPESVTDIAAGAFSSQTVVRAAVGSPAHFAAAADGCETELICPENGLRTSVQLTAIEDDAFRGNAVLAFADLSRSPLTTIGSGAFRDCPALRAVMLPDSVDFIAADAFDAGVLIICAPDAYAARWADEHGFTALAYGGK